jgi:hypothetical protein
MQVLSDLSLPTCLMPICRPIDRLPPDPTDACLQGIFLLVMPVDILHRAVRLPIPLLPAHTGLLDFGKCHPF